MNVNRECDSKGWETLKKQKHLIIVEYVIVVNISRYEF